MQIADCGLRIADGQRAKCTGHGVRSQNPAIDKEKTALKCPHCGESLGTVRCPACERLLPEDSQYCCWCGQKVSGVVHETDAEFAEAAAEGNDEDTVDFASRKLCSDGTCIGVIGGDGRCKECGKPYKGEPEMD